MLLFKTGNYSKQQALDVVRHVKDSLRSGDRIRSALPPIRICEVPIGQKWCRLASFHKTDTNSVVVNYYQTGPTNLRQMAVMEILVVSTCFNLSKCVQWTLIAKVLQI
jgi:hypothetical protein